MDKRSKWETTSCNGRFGVMAAVAPQKRQCENERLYPAESVVEAATTPSRWDVSGKAEARQCGIETEEKNRQKMYKVIIMNDK